MHTWRRQPSGDTWPNTDWTEYGDNNGLAWDDMIPWENLSRYWRNPSRNVTPMKLEMNNILIAPPNPATVQCQLRVKGDTASNLRYDVQILEDNVVRHTKENISFSSAEWGNSAYNADLSAVGDWSTIEVKVYWDVTSVTDHIFLACIRLIPTP